jgi:hypothetical protein
MKIILLIVLISISHSTLAQSSFFKTYKRPSHERTFSAIETPTGSFIVTGEMRETGYFGVNQGYIAKLSSSGEIVKEILINPNNNSRVCMIIPYKHENADYLCIGSTDSAAGSDLYSRIFFYGLDSNLNLTEQKLFSFQKDNIVVPWRNYISGDSIMYLLNDNISSSKDSKAINFISVIKYHLPFDSLSNFKADFNSYSQDLIYKVIKKEIDVYIIQQRLIIQLDEDLNYIATKHYNNDFPSTIDLTRFSDASYLFTGGAFNQINTNSQIGCFHYDTDDVAIDSLFYTPSTDTNFYGGARENTVINGNNVFISGFYNVDAWMFPYNYNPSWVTITKTDINLNVISTHFFGGDAQYCPYSIIATADGGCFVNGYSYDYLNNLQFGDYELDVFALKVNSEGIITDIPEVATWKYTNAIVYPNPGRDNLTIQSGPQINGALFSLFDMQGHTLLEEKITTTQSRINTLNLSSGTYLWRIIYKGKIIETGKWVKE